VDLGERPAVGVAPPGLLDAVSRRVGLTLPELRLAAELAGGAPLPFDVAAPPSADPLEARLGPGPGRADAAYADALAALADPRDTLARRGLVDGAAKRGLDAGVAGALGMLGTPEAAVQIDVVVGGVQARAWHHRSGPGVATLATADGLVFELSWLPVAGWPWELTRAATLPRDLVTEPSSVPDEVAAPFALLDAAGEALHSRRADLVPLLAGHHAGSVHEGDRPLADADVAALLQHLASETRGRLRALVSDLTGSDRASASSVAGVAGVIGVVSWLLLADGWHSVELADVASEPTVRLRRVQAADLARQLAPVLAEVQP